MLGNKFVVAAELYNAPLLEHHDRVGIAHRGEAVRDHERRAPAHELIHTAPNEHFGTRVDGTRRFVQNDGRRVGHGRARNGEELPLPLAQVRPIRGHHRVISIWQTPDEAIGVGDLRGSAHLFVRGVKLAKANVVGNRAGEQVRILQHDAERGA